MSAINGESIPATKEIGDDLFAGTVNLSGAIQMEMTKPSSETLFQKIIALVQSAQSEKSPSQQFIERFEGTYVKIVIVAVIVMMVLPIMYSVGIGIRRFTVPSFFSSSRHLVRLWLRLCPPHLLQSRTEQSVAFCLKAACTLSTLVHFA